MEINSTGSIDSYTGISGTGFNRSVNEEKAPPPFPVGEENMSISGPGKMMSKISGMSEEEKAEMDAFRDTVMSALENGTFDAAALAEEAPESMAEFADENGMDLEKMVEGMAKGPKGKEGAPPPPPPMYGSDGKGVSLNDEDDEDYLSALLSNSGIAGQVSEE